MSLKTHKRQGVNWHAAQEHCAPWNWLLASGSRVRCDITIPSHLRDYQVCIVFFHVPVCMWVCVHLFHKEDFFFFRCRSDWKSLDGAGLVKPRFTVAPACDCPLFQQGKSLVFRFLKPFCLLHPLAAECIFLFPQSRIKMAFLHCTCYPYRFSSAFSVQVNDQSFLISNSCVISSRILTQNSVDSVICNWI